MSREQNDLVSTFVKEIFSLGFESASTLFSLDDLLNKAKEENQMESFEKFLNQIVAECVARRITPGERGDKVVDGEREYSVDKIEQLRIFQEFLNRNHINVKNALNGHPDIVSAALNAPSVTPTVPAADSTSIVDFKEVPKIDLEESYQLYQKMASQLIHQIISSFQKATAKVDESWGMLVKSQQIISELYDLSKTPFDYGKEQENVLRPIVEAVGVDSSKVFELDSLFNMAKKSWPQCESSLSSILRPYLDAMVYSTEPKDIELTALLLRHGTEKGKINVENWELVANVILNAKPETVKILLTDLLAKGSKIQPDRGRFHIPNEIGPIKDLMEVVVTYCLGAEPNQMANIKILFKFLDDHHINLQHALNSYLSETIQDGRHDIAYLLLAHGVVPKDARSLADNDIYKKFIQEAHNKGVISKENLDKYLPKAYKDDLSVIVPAMINDKSGLGFYREVSSPSVGASAEDVLASSPIDAFN